MSALSRTQESTVRPCFLQESEGRGEGRRDGVICVATVGAHLALGELATYDVYSALRKKEGWL